MICNCCGSNKFNSEEVLWDKLIQDWSLSEYEVNYINRQQGYTCDHCGSSLRVIALATAIMRNFNYEGKFKDFVRKRSFKNLKILEINPAGCLSQFFSGFKKHTLISYPDIDIMTMPYGDQQFDLIIHSDVLEHVENPVKGLCECYRVLKKSGICIFTVPIIVDRTTISRINKVASYHGSSENNESDLLVHTEYGSDAWKQVIQAGFSECRIYSHEYPSANVLTGVK
ncbi:MAG: class I SAM-dependent methyltransferase [Thermosynechococcaceae cyanobacterium]